MFKDLKTLHPGGDSNPESTVLETDTMTTKPARFGISKNLIWRGRSTFPPISYSGSTSLDQRVWINRFSRFGSLAINLNAALKKIWVNVFMTIFGDFS
jgi:hypothetical protein